MALNIKPFDAPKHPEPSEPVHFPVASTAGQAGESLTRKQKDNQVLEDHKKLTLKQIKERMQRLLDKL